MRNQKVKLLNTQRKHLQKLPSMRLKNMKRRNQNMKKTSMRRSQNMRSQTLRMVDMGVRRSLKRNQTRLRIHSSTSDDWFIMPGLMKYMW